MSESSQSMLYPNPFSRAYWRTAAREFRSTKMLVFAALMIALRVALKSLSIPVGVDLRINVTFFVNAYGAMVFGPVVAIAAAAVSDTLGCLLFPTGAYFFPFIFIEIAGSLIFALLLYRAQVSVARVILSRFLIDFLVNVVLNTPVMMLYYKLVMGKYYAVFDLPRIAKNLALFPVEAFLLILFLRAVIPPTKSAGLIYAGAEKLRLTKRHVALLIALFALGCASVFGYSVYSYNTTSLSASYSAEERLEKNQSMGELVAQHHPELDEARLVAVIESALPKFGDPNLRCVVAVYEAAQPDADMEALRSYSKSKARKDETLAPLGTATVVLDRKSGAPVSYEDDLK